MWRGFASGSRRTGRPSARRLPQASVYTGEVEVEVGPLNDFAQLTGFEDAAAGIDGASEIKVKRFSGGRAWVSMNLENPIDLLRELEEKAPFDFVVRDTRRNGVVLDVDEGDAEQNRAA